MRSPHSEWNSLYASYSEELKAFVRLRVPADESDDILQDVWASLADTLQDEPPQHVRAWLYRVSRNRIADLYRTRSVQPPAEDLSPEYDTADEATGTDVDSDRFWLRLREALDVLPATQREVFTRNELEGETLREIAADLGIPLKTAISRKGYARLRLQDLLRDTYEEYFGTE